MLRDFQLADLFTLSNAFCGMGSVLATLRCPGPHHAPLFDSWHAAPDSLYRGGYCNDLRDVFGAHAIDLWVHGHVHARSDYRAGPARVVCNPRGYDVFQLVDGFDMSLTVDVGTP